MVSPATSSSRPISSVSAVGRLVGTESGERGGGNRPSPTWNTACDPAISAKRCGPKLTSTTPEPASAAVAAEHNTWPRDRSP